MHRANSAIAPQPASCVGKRFENNGAHKMAKLTRLSRNVRGGLAADVLAPCVARPSAAIMLIK